MAGEDYSVKTKVTADVSNFEKGMNKAEKSLKGFSDKLADNINRLGKKGLVGSIANVTLAMQGLTKSFSTVIKFTKDVGKAINECTEAYKGQVIAERALDTAIQNNPFISGESSKALKQFASEMQRVSNYGDEELIPMMANLVSLGRTESETMQIMSVAMDMSAGMGISLDSAITQLNATLNGSIGRLGQQNAELKSLSEEELRSGRAVEILGEKFKGFSSATADTSKQLQNIKGDFKEALGQFTLPSSDLWNKFWAGFYQKGIEAINKINAFMDSQIIGKKLANAITEQIARINPADIGGRVDYTKSVLKVISDSELIALENYLKGLKRLSSEQEIILKRIGAEKQGRQFVAEEAKKEAEDKKKQADAEAQITAELQKQEEISKKKTDWASKLLDQRIEMLETERDRAMQLAEEEGKESYTIWRDYNEKILELKLQRLEEEKNKSLQEEGLTEEDKIAIEEYYSGETKKIYDELGNYKKKKGKEEEKDEKSKLATMLEYAKKYADNIKNVLSKISSEMKKVFSSIKNVFSKALEIFKFNPDDALDSLLAIEDTILTFFVETLPKLPQFFSSAIQSIVILLDTLLKSIDWNKVQEIINSIIDVIIEYTPTIIEDLVNVVINIAQAVLNGIIHFVQSGGWKMLLNLLLEIQQKIEQFFIDNIDEIVDTIVAMLPDLIEFISHSIESASKTLGKLAPKIIPLIADLINAIVEAITSDEVMESFYEALEGIVDGLVQGIIKLMTKAVPRLIVFGTKLVSDPITLSKTAVAIIKGIISAFAKTDWGQVVEDIFTSFIDAFKDLFGIHSPSTLFEGFGFNMIEGLWNGIKNMGPWLNENVFVFFSSLWEGIKNIFSGVGDWFGNVFRNAKDRIVSAFEGIGNWASGVWDKIKGGFSNVGGWFSTTFSSASSAIKNAFSGLGDWFNDLWNNIKSGASSVGDAIGGAVSKAGEWAGGVGEKVWDWGKSVGEGIQDAFDDASDWFEDVADGVTDWVDSWKFWATGTNVAPKGLAVVGEQGPELVKFNGGEQVLNTRNTQKALEGVGGSTNNFNVTFNNLQDTSAFAMMNQLKQYNRQMAINGVI